MLGFSRISPTLAQNALAVWLFVGGMSAGLLLWGSGADVALQLWLDANHHPAIDTASRTLGAIGLGRNLVWGLLLMGFGAALWQGGLRGVLDAARLWLLQAAAWLRGRWAWLPGWQGQPWLCRVLLCAIWPLALTGVLQIVLKFLIGRPRPKEILWNGTDPFAAQPLVFDASYWSLPSGHTASTFAIFVWLALAFPRLRLPLVLAAVIISSGRFLAITPHYLGDVVAGAGLGAAVALFIWNKAKQS